METNNVATEKPGQKNTMGPEEGQLTPKKGPVPLPAWPVIHLYDTVAAREALQGIRLAAVSEKESAQLGNEAVTSNTVALVGATATLASELTVSDKKACSMCDIEFQDRPEQHEHYKSDWHRFNLKQRMRGNTTVGEDRFQELMGDVSSISGSDTEDCTGTGSEYDTDPGRDSPGPRAKRSPPKDRLQAVLQERSSGTESEPEGAGHIEGIGRRHPKVFLRNDQGELLSVYRCVVHCKKNQPETQEDLLAMVQQLPETMCWAVVMVAGGHFAAAVFDKDEVIAHKTFHRYVVRAKRGTAQSTRDAQGNAPKSAGARLRRYNEQALKQDIHDLLTEQWKDHIAKCDHIFLRAPSYNKSTFFGGKHPLFDKHDARIRMIPFQTRRPTLNEAKRVHDVLASMACHGKDSEIMDHIAVASPKKTGIARDEASRNSKDSNLPKRGPFKAKLPQGIPDPVSDSSDSEDEGEILLRMVEHTSLTSELKEYECTRRPRRKAKKDKMAKGVSDEAVKTGVILDEETVQWRNKLYTACKTGDLDNFRQLIEKFSVDTVPTTESAPPVTSEAEATSVQVEVTPEAEPTEDDRTRTASDNICDTLTTKEINEEFSCDSVSSPKTASPPSEQGTGTGDTESGAQKVLQAVLNQPFGESKTTLLHVAAKSGHGQVACMLMEFGSDVCLRDKNGQLPYTVSADKATRNEFRKFRGSHPDLHDYDKAQIPEPLTSEMEQEKKAKDTERKKAQRKARKEKMKDQKAEQAKQREEDREKQRFLALSDREKRALAAEKRLTAQAKSQGLEAPVMSRCFQCAADMTGKVPFEYYKFKFCSPRCLQKHKKDTAS